MSKRYGGGAAAGRSGDSCWQIAARVHDCMPTKEQPEHKPHSGEDVARLRREPATGARPHRMPKLGRKSVGGMRWILALECHQLDRDARSRSRPR